MSHNVVWWLDSRPAKNQGQIIWARPQLVLPNLDTNGVAKVRGIREFQAKMIDEHGGMGEVLIPTHKH